MIKSDFSPGSPPVLIVASWKGECLEASLAQIVALSAQRSCIGKVYFYFKVFEEPTLVQVQCGLKGGAERNGDNDVIF